MEFRELSARSDLSSLRKTDGLTASSPLRLPKRRLDRASAHSSILVHRVGEPGTVLTRECPSRGTGISRKLHETAKPADSEANTFPLSEALSAGQIGRSPGGANVEGPREPY